MTQASTTSGRQNVYHYMAGWQQTGTTRGIPDELREQVRDAAGHNPNPTAAIIDPQSVKATEALARDQRGYDADKTTAANGTPRSTSRAICSWS